MSYQVLARKWRPKNFDEVVGQDQIVRVLKNALSQQRLHHAYLFSGTRGVGKTTLARIFAKCLNCDIGITSTPCGKCNACLEVDKGTFIDLIEVDAASKTKIEDTRELLDNVQYLPAKGRYRVYLIDEVHMLSGHSFNALLKTLEEPPDHVKFLFATTDPHKLPMTILSRCLQFNLRSLSAEIIQRQLGHILRAEGIYYEDEALHLIGMNAKGSVRDALSLLDQAIVFGVNSVKIQDVRKMMRSIDHGKIMELLIELSKNNIKRMLELIDELAVLAIDFWDAMDGILEILHSVAVKQLLPDHISGPPADDEIVSKLASAFTKEDTQLYYQIALLAKRDLVFAANPKQGFEMMVLRMFAFYPDSSTSVNTVEFIPIKEKDELLTNKSSSVLMDNKQLDLEKLEITEPTRVVLQHCLVSKITENEVELLVDPNQKIWLNKKHEDRIREAITKYYNRPFGLTIKVGPFNMPTVGNSAKEFRQREAQKNLEAVAGNPVIRNLKENFGAELVTDFFSDS